MGKKKVGNQLRLPPQARTEKGIVACGQEGSSGKGTGIIAKAKKTRPCSAPSLEVGHPELVEGSVRPFPLTEADGTDPSTGSG